MKRGPDCRPPLKGIVKLEEKYFGGKPRYKTGVRTSAATKHQILGAEHRPTTPAFQSFYNQYFDMAILEVIGVHECNFQECLKDKRYVRRLVFLFLNPIFFLIPAR
jgi:hypothetical protein